MTKSLGSPPLLSLLSQEALDELAQGGYKNVATCFTERSQSLYKCDLTCDKLALWVGNEFAGLSGLAISAADTELFIPMRGMIQSLNLSVAAAVCLNEISRQRTSVDPDGCRFAPTEAEQNIEALGVWTMNRNGGPVSLLLSLPRSLLRSLSDGHVARGMRPPQVQRQRQCRVLQRHDTQPVVRRFQLGQLCRQASLLGGRRLRGLPGDMSDQRESRLVGCWMVYAL